MKILLKRMLIGLLIFTTLFLAFIYSYHQYKLKQEEALLKPTGTMIKASGNNLHVYTEGDGEHTFVFMSGAGNAAPQYEFKPLFEKFSASNKIAVVDRAGYGFSDVADDSRSVDIILEQTRFTLLKSNLQPPYVLVPHSISSLEALHWAQLYPDEVVAIIGLDIGLPNEYIEYEMTGINNIIVQGLHYLSSVGLHRLFPSLVYNETILLQHYLTEEEKEIYKALSFKQTFNKNMRDELLQATQNSKRVNNLPLPIETPILLIDAYINPNSPAAIERLEQSQLFADQFNMISIVQVESSHSLYLYVPDDIYNYSVEFLEQLNL